MPDYHDAYRFRLAGRFGNGGSRALWGLHCRYNEGLETEQSVSAEKGVELGPASKRLLARKFCISHR